MRRRLVAALALVVLAGCAEANPPGARRADSDENDGIPGTFYRTHIDGMACVVWIHEYGGGQAKDSFSGLDCDWTSGG